MNTGLDLQNFLKTHQERKIVFTNGCFDILHRGHLSYLREAQSLGDKLVIGLNSDESVRALKGDHRPINNEGDRKFFLESLKYVDFVETFSEPTPLELIKKVRPSFLVKGGDWDVSQIVGHDFVESINGKTLSLPFIEHYSTTSFIEKVQGKA